jgi:hypothetical protein
LLVKAAASTIPLFSRGREATRSALPGGGFFFSQYRDFFFFVYSLSYRVEGAGGRQRRARCLGSGCHSLGELSGARAAASATGLTRGAPGRRIFLFAISGFLLFRLFAELRIG